MVEDARIKYQRREEWRTTQSELGDGDVVEENIATGCNGDDDANDEDIRSDVVLHSQRRNNGVEVEEAQWWVRIVK